MKTEHFTSEVAAKLKVYVYRLIDPRTGETFYVGKGQGDRVFSHSRAELKADDDAEENKVRRIRDIRQSGFEVSHVIHRHGMDDMTALEVEAAVIDAYPGLTNIANGSGSDEFGVMHGDEIDRRYSATVANLEDIKAVLINVNRSAAERDLYEATRYCWKMSLDRAKQADYVLPTIQGMIAGCLFLRSGHALRQKTFQGESLTQIESHLKVVGRRTKSARSTRDTVYRTRIERKVRRILFAILGNNGGTTGSGFATPQFARS